MNQATFDVVNVVLKASMDEHFFPGAYNIESTLVYNGGDGKRRRLQDGASVTYTATGATDEQLAAAEVAESEADFSDVLVMGSGSGNWDGEALFLREEPGPAPASPYDDQ